MCDALYLYVWCSVFVCMMDLLCCFIPAVYLGFFIFDWYWFWMACNIAINWYTLHVFVVVHDPRVWSLRSSPLGLLTYSMSQKCSKCSRKRIGVQPVTRLHYTWMHQLGHLIQCHKTWLFLKLFSFKANANVNRGQSSRFSAEALLNHSISSVRDETTLQGLGAISVFMRNTLYFLYVW